MLRDIRHPYLSPRLVSLKYTTASNVVTINQGVGSATITSAATGSGVVTFSRAFARKPLLVATASSNDVAAGGFVSGTANTYPTATGFTTKTVNSSATADDGTAYCLFLGYDQKDAVRRSRRANVVRGDLDQSKVVALRIDTSKTTIATGVTINARAVRAFTQNGTGDVTLSLRSAFANSSFVAVGTAVLATGQIVQVHVTNSDTVQVKVFTNGGTTPADGVVNLILVGDSQGPAERTAATPAMSDQRKPVLFGFSVIYSGGVPALDFNLGDATLVDTSTGVTTHVFTQAFARTPIICAYPIANTGVQCCTISGDSSTGFVVRQFSSANAAADCTDASGYQVIGIGFDDGSEY